ncbi:MAG: septal ring lytic transglycosylase RlpA family protein [Burkholderiaceae bacterium]|nr:septal ring lytic transglycosylase RlpA family protein [Ideonella sp.]MCC7288707.1 septal ring lytic transglycosylase RlpA family protein [Burkholderiaceae bacterium]
MDSRSLRHGCIVFATGALAAALSGCGLLAPEPPAPPPAAPPPAAPPPVVPPSVVLPPAALTKPPAPPKPQRPPLEAKPRVERLRSGPPNHAYEIKGQRYQPEHTDVPMFERGLASWYGAPFHGKRTASGERYDMNAMTAAHKTMPLPSYALVRNPANGRQVVVKVNDRGPFVKGRIIDLSRAAARKLRIGGVSAVEVRRLTHDEIKTGAWKLPSQRVAKAP